MSDHTQPQSAMLDTRIADPTTVHTGIAEALSDAAAVLTNHSTLPGICRCAIEWRHDEDRPRIAAWVHAKTDELDALLQWVEATDTEQVTVRRFIEPHAFTVVTAHCEQGVSLVEVSTQPAEKELAALWHATGQKPEPAVTVTVTVDALRAAVASLSEPTPDGAEITA